jgi:hypothetical protein
MDSDLRKYLLSSAKRRTTRCSDKITEMENIDPTAIRARELVHTGSCTFSAATNYGATCLAISPQTCDDNAPLTDARQGGKSLARGSFRLGPASALTGRWGEDNHGAKAVLP